MTAFDRLDVLDARVSGALDEIAAPSRPDYLDDIFQVTARTRQRPRWTFLERWLPMDTAIVRPAGRFRAIPMRPWSILSDPRLARRSQRSRSLVGSRHRPRHRSGLRATAASRMATAATSTSATRSPGEPRLLVGGPGVQGAVTCSRSTAR